MIEFYAQIKWVHVATVLVSGALFLLRGLLIQAGLPRLAMAGAVRYLSYAIDTILLSAAMMLLTILPGAMFANGWLTVKMVSLVIYIVLASLALKRARTPRMRLVCYGLALLVFAFMLSVARSHHPLGAFFWWFG
ncbi:MAG: SirB2 family protein [Pseudomonadota bacterium]